jgi:histone acetyltransferase (RNA polymerase elongator complex component)
LEIFGNGNLTTGTIVSAQRFSNLTFNAIIDRYLNVSAATSSIDVAVRIVIWIGPLQPVIVLLKTYNDYSWHTEIIDLLSFGINVSEVYMIELGWQQVYDSANQSIVRYRQLSFNKMEQI